MTEYVNNERIRLISDAGGTIWDSVFSVKPVDGQTELTLTKALEQDMDCVKS